jgi:hypothetical protein
MPYPDSVRADPCSRRSAIPRRTERQGEQFVVTPTPHPRQPQPTHPRHVVGSPALVLAGTRSRPALIVRSGGGTVGGGALATNAPVPGCGSPVSRVGRRFIPGQPTTPHPP